MLLCNTMDPCLCVHDVFMSIDMSILHILQMENQVIVSDYSQMDRILREERQYILNICKKIKKAGCNVLLIQKSILRCVGLAANGSFCLP